MPVMVAVSLMIICLGVGILIGGCIKDWEDKNGANRL